jgi:RNA polymerase sigma-32 factor
MKQRFKAADAEAEVGTHRETLSEGQINAMAATLNVKREEVMEMETRLSGGDVMLDPGPSADGEESYGPIAYLTDTRHEPTAMIEATQRDVLASDGIATALEALDDRSRRIVEERWLKVNDDASGGMTLHELAAVYGVSAERIRQIEVAAMKKMKKTLVEYS